MSRVGSKRALEKSFFLIFFFFVSDFILLISPTTSSPRPVVVELMEQFDDEDGLPEKLAQKNPNYQK